MNITIEIPDFFIDGDNTMINIFGDTFRYGRLDKRLHTISSQFSQADEDKQDRLMLHLDAISKIVVEIVKEGLM